MSNFQTMKKRGASYRQDYAEAVAHGLTADSQAGKQPVNPECRSSTKNQPVNLERRRIK